jgi:hypothetical protein
MKLYELLNEDAYRAKTFFNKNMNAVAQVTERGKKVAAFLKKNCAIWLKQTDNGRVKAYRGYEKSGKNEMAFTKKVRKNRVPKDSGAYEHKAFNFLIKKCGKIANRENSVFVSGDMGQADNYGNVFVTIPIGKFAYTWHEDFDDWTGDVGYHNYLQKIRPEPKIPHIQQLKIKYEEELARNTKDVEPNINRVKKFFNQLGIKVTKTQIANIGMELYDIHSWGETGTMSFGNLKNPFPNIMNGEKATYGPSWNSRVVKSKPLKELWLQLREMSKADKLVIRKRIVAVKNAAEKIRKATNWLNRNGSFPAFKENYEWKMRRNNEETDNTFTVGKDHISKLDKEELDRFCKGLYGDDGSLSRAINADVELMIATKTVIAIEDDFYDEVVLQLLNGHRPTIDDEDAQTMLRGFDSSGW